MAELDAFTKFLEWLVKLGPYGVAGIAIVAWIWERNRADRLERVLTDIVPHATTAMVEVKNGISELRTLFAISASKGNGTGGRRR